MLLRGVTFALSCTKCLLPLLRDRQRQKASNLHRQLHAGLCRRSTAAIGGISNSPAFCVSLKGCPAHQLHQQLPRLPKPAASAQPTKRPTSSKKACPGYEMSAGAQPPVEVSRSWPSSQAATVATQLTVYVPKPGT